MKGIWGRIIAPIAAIPLATSFALDALAQPVEPAAASSSIEPYLPELQRLKRTADWAGLERLSRQALTALQSGSRPDSLGVGEAERWLANSLCEEGRYGDAEPLFRRALMIHEGLGATDQTQTAATLNDFALLLDAQGRYAEAEPLYRRALTIRETLLGPEHPDTAEVVNNLAGLLVHQGQYAIAEPLYRRALATREKALGAEDVATSETLNDFGLLLINQGHYREAETLIRRALAIREKVLRPDHPGLAVTLINLGSALTELGHFAEAEPFARRALAINEKELGSEHPRTATTLRILAGLMRNQGRYTEAEPLYRRALAIDEKTLGPTHPSTGIAIGALAGSLQDQGRYEEAESLYRRALAVEEQAVGREHPSLAAGLANLALQLTYEGRYAEAEPLSRRALAIREKALGPEHTATSTSLNDLALLLIYQSRYGEAEPLLRRAVAIREKALGAKHPYTAVVLDNLGWLLQLQRRYAEAEPLLRRALAIRELTLGAQHPRTAGSRINLGGNDEFQGKFDDAAGNYRLACSTRSSLARSRDLSGGGAHAAESLAISCRDRLSLLLWSWSAQGGGLAVSNRPDALRREAFAAAQLAEQSAAGTAMARSAALKAAQSAAVGPQAEAYEAALLERDGVDRRFALAATNSGQQGVEQREALAEEHDAVLSKIERLAAELKSKAPLYWDYRSPQPVSVEALQAQTGADDVLLRDDEALILFMVGPAKERGLVFAVSKEQVAWARLGQTADQLKARVSKLRAQIDPAGYGLPAPGKPRESAIGAAKVPGAFDRQAAYVLYQMLLGDPAIQAVIHDKPVLLFVPSGALTSLPPGLLLTAPPADGEAGDADPEVLREAPWLLRSKAVAVLPAVSSLRTLRQFLPAARASTPDPLLAFTDPDFRRAAIGPHVSRAAFAARSFSTYFRDGSPLAEALDGLPALPGTRIEGEALQRALSATPGSVLTGKDASKAQLMTRNADGRLARVRVLEFATHGLVAGDASDLAEPALVLAAGATPADELLLASEAATLKLNADWVLLSACNTASPDAPEAQGLSGLTRAFFYAGAKSLLVSHWRVRDDVAPQLIPDVLVRERKDPTMSRAEALRQASLAVLDNRALNAANPSAWAAFTLIGEAGR
jgi:CHAT domain-containing protein/Tfp pilus assembly protein PilF